MRLAACLCVTGIAGPRTPPGDAEAMRVLPFPEISQRNGATSDVELGPTTLLRRRRGIAGFSGDRMRFPPGGTWRGEAASGVSGKKVDNGSAQDADVGLRGPGPSSSRTFRCAPPRSTPSHDLDALTGDPAGRLRPLCRPNYQTHH